MISSSAMGKVDELLAQYTAKDDETKGKVLGAALVVTDSKGVSQSFTEDGNVANTN